MIGEHSNQNGSHYSCYVNSKAGIQLDIITRSCRVARRACRDLNNPRALRLTKPSHRDLDDAFVQQRSEQRQARLCRTLRIEVDRFKARQRLVKAGPVLCEHHDAIAVKDRGCSCRDLNNPRALRLTKPSHRDLDDAFVQQRSEQRQARLCRTLRIEVDRFKARQRLVKAGPVLCEHHDAIAVKDRGCSHLV